MLSLEKSDDNEFRYDWNADSNMGFLISVRTFIVAAFRLLSITDLRAFSNTIIAPTFAS